MKKRILIILALLICMTGCTQNKKEVPKYEYNIEEQTTREEKVKKPKEVEYYFANVSVSDPALISDGKQYYLMGTNMITVVSSNLKTWNYIGDGYQSDNPIYGDLWEQGSNVFAYSGSAESIIATDDGGEHVWKPSVIYNDVTKQYMLYYSTPSNEKASSICFGVSDGISGPYNYKQTILYSGFDESTASKTDLYGSLSKNYKKYLKEDGTYNELVYPNAISPYVFFDEKHELWMVYGSKLGGIYLLPLNTKTGEPRRDGIRKNEGDYYYGYHLLGGQDAGIEEPSIVYNEETGYYYLFVSYGKITRDGGYQIRVLRSNKVTGPYLDMSNHTMNSVFDYKVLGLKLSGNYQLEKEGRAYKATGSSSIFITEDNKFLMSYQTRFDGSSEYSEPRIKQMIFNKEGWPVLLPYFYQEEIIEPNGYSISDMAGKYEMICQGSDVDSKVVKPIRVELTEDGKIIGETVTGKWITYEGTYYAVLIYHEEGQQIITFSGVFCKQKNEMGETVMVFSGVGNNKSLWGVKQ